MYYAYIGILLIGVVGFVVRSAKFDDFGLDLQIKLFFVSIVLVTLLWESMRLIDRLLGRAFPFEKSVPQRVVAQLASGALFGLALRAFLYYFGEPYVPVRLDRLFLAATWVIYMLFPMAIMLGFITFHLVERWKSSMILTEKLEKEKSQVQFDNLRNQLNPHFLFNAFTSLNSLIHEDQELASKFLQQLSKVYRYVLKNKDTTIVSLEIELDFIQHYVSLLKTRFGPALEIDFNILPAAREKAVAPVTLQILIENALKHNITDVQRPLRIEITADSDYLEVSNNLQIKKRVEDSNKQGLENLKNLYRFITSRPVEIIEDENLFTVRIPLV